MVKKKMNSHLDPYTIPPRNPPIAAFVCALFFPLQSSIREVVEANTAAVAPF